jgi:hypothetical protein
MSILTSIAAIWLTYWISKYILKWLSTKGKSL